MKILLENKQRVCWKTSKQINKQTIKKGTPHRNANILWKTREGVVQVWLRDYFSVVKDVAMTTCLFSREKGVCVNIWLLVQLYFVSLVILFYFVFISCQFVIFSDVIKRKHFFCPKRIYFEINYQKNIYHRNSFPFPIRSSTGNYSRIERYMNVNSQPTMTLVPGADLTMRIYATRWSMLKYKIL